jgi:hypothetical protein
MDRFTIFATLIGYIAIAFCLMIGLYTMYLCTWVLILVYRAIRWVAYLDPKENRLVRSYEETIKIQGANYILSELRETTS